MTAFIRAFLFCNGCGVPFDNNAVPSAENTSGARRDAKRVGWVHRRDGQDLCPDCNEGTEES